MAETRGPVRHRRPARPSYALAPVPLSGAPSGAGSGEPAVPPAQGDLQAVFTTLARRAKLPTTAEATPRAVLRAAGLPLLMATVVAAVHPVPAAAEPPPAAGPASAPQAGPEAWTVTRLDPSTGDPSSGDPSSSDPSPDDGTPGPPPRGDGTPRVTYTVRPDDTLQRVADLSGRSVAALLEANGLVPGRPITPGQVLVLPPTTRAARPPVPPTGTAPARTASTRTTPARTTPQKPGTPKAAPAEAPRPKATPPKTAPGKAAPAKTAPPKTTPPKTTPEKATPEKATPEKATPEKATPEKAAPEKAAPAKAAQARATPAKAVQAKVGQPRTTSPVAARPTRIYVVASGDTLIHICERANVDLRNVLALNHLRVDSIIRPGQRLVLPAPQDDTSGGRAYPPAVVAAANANRRALAAMKVPSRHQVKTMIVDTARQHGLDPALALAVAYQESGFNHRSVSPANAVGVMQVIPSTGRWASTVLGRPLDLLDAQDNVTAGVVLLETLSRSADSPAQTIAGYYQGLASVRAAGVFDDTRRYVANVQTLQARFAKTL